jgi:hypothetical protein
MILKIQQVYYENTANDFLLLVFFMGQFPPSPRVSHLDRFEFFRKFAEIFTSQGAPLVSTILVATGVNENRKSKSKTS